MPDEPLEKKIDEKLDSMKNHKKQLEKPPKTRSFRRKREKKVLDEIVLQRRRKRMGIVAMSFAALLSVYLFIGKPIYNKIQKKEQAKIERFDYYESTYNQLETLVELGKYFEAKSLALNLLGNIKEEESHEKEVLFIKTDNLYNRRIVPKVQEIESQKEKADKEFYNNKLAKIKSDYDTIRKKYKNKFGARYYWNYNANAESELMALNQKSEELQRSLKNETSPAIKSIYDQAVSFDETINSTLVEVWRSGMISRWNKKFWNRMTNLAMKYNGARAWSYESWDQYQDAKSDEYSIFHNDQKTFHNQEKNKFGRLINDATVKKQMTRKINARIRENESYIRRHKKNVD